jgi:hypothetical protein
MKRKVFPEVKRTPGIMQRITFQNEETKHNWRRTVLDTGKGVETRLNPNPCGWGVYDFRNFEEV